MRWILALVALIGLYGQAVGQSINILPGPRAETPLYSLPGFTVSWPGAGRPYTGAIPGGTCPRAGAGYADGCAAAPTCAPQHPTYLDGYVVRPPWDVAGVDYCVGIPDGISLTDWVTSPPPGCTVDNSPGSLHWMRCTGTNNILFSNIDFSTNGGGFIYLESSNDAILTNVKFGGSNAPNFPVALVQCAGTTKGLTVRNSILDGGFTSTGQSAGQSALVNCGGGNGNIELKYVWFKNYGQHVLETGSSTILYHFNLIDNALIEAGGHMNCQQLYDGIINTSVVFNFMYQSSPNGAECFQFYGGVAPTITLQNATLSNNTFVALTGCCSNLNSAPTLRTIFVGPAVSNQNYFNPAGGTPYYPGDFVGWTGSGNLNMLTGGTVTFPPSP